MMEAALVFDTEGKTIHWHLPPGRSGGSIPDTRDLWEVLWENRQHLGGVAHTHPWHGEAWPSNTDVTTFRAVEQGLGKLLLWPVVTFSEVGYFAFNERTKEYVKVDNKYVPIDGTIDVEELRALSR